MKAGTRVSYIDELNLWSQGLLLGPPTAGNRCDVRAGNRSCKVKRAVQVDAAVQAVRGETSDKTETYIRRVKDGILVS